MSPDSNPGYYNLSPFRDIPSPPTSPISTPPSSPSSSPSNSANKCKSAPWTALGGNKLGVQTSQNIGTHERAYTRNILRNAYNNVCNFKARGMPGWGKTTPFRIVTNAGDPNGTTNENPSSNMPRQANLVNGIQSGLTLSRVSFAGPQNNGNAYYTGNPSYVYDSSNYTTYKKNISIQNNYNDISDGGDEKPTVFMALMRVRH